MWLEEKSIVATAVEWSVTNIAVLILLACFHSYLYFKTSFVFTCRAVRAFICSGLIYAADIAVKFPIYHACDELILF